MRPTHSLAKVAWARSRPQRGRAWPAWPAAGRAKQLAAAGRLALQRARRPLLTALPQPGARPPGAAAALTRACCPLPCISRRRQAPAVHTMYLEADAGASSREQADRSSRARGSAGCVGAPWGCCALLLLCCAACSSGQHSAARPHDARTAGPQARSASWMAARSPQAAAPLQRRTSSWRGGCMRSSTR